MIKSQKKAAGRGINGVRERNVGVKENVFLATSKLPQETSLSIPTNAICSRYAVIIMVVKSKY